MRSQINFKGVRAIFSIFWIVCIPADASTLKNESSSRGRILVRREQAAKDETTGTSDAQNLGIEARSHILVDPAGRIRAHKFTPQEAVMTFLFAVNDDLKHKDVWKAFLRDAPPHSVRMFVHCEQPEACEKSSLFQEFPSMKRVGTVPTHYCRDLATMQVQLLRGALKDSPPNVIEKFIFVSDSTLPLKPFAEMQSTLGSDNDSDLCIFPTFHWPYAKDGDKDTPEFIMGDSIKRGETTYLVKAQQWVILNKAHAKIMVDQWKPVEPSGHWSLPLHNDRSTMVDFDIFERTAESTACADEYAFFSTIWGAPTMHPGQKLALDGFGGKYLSLNKQTRDETQGRCRTFVGGHLMGEYFEGLEADLASDFPSTRVSCYPFCGTHPMSFLQVSNASLLLLRRSPLLFGRKFDADTLHVPSFMRIMFAESPPGEVKPISGEVSGVAA